MEKKYITLFNNLAIAVSNSAEAVMDYDRKKEDEKGLQTATKMRDDYLELATKINESGDNYQVTKEDAARLLVGAMIIINQLRDQVTTLQNAIVGYQSDVIPKLQAIVDNSKTDEDAAKLAEKKFIIETNG